MLLGIFISRQVFDRQTQDSAQEIIKEEPKNNASVQAQMRLLAAQVESNRRKIETKHDRLDNTHSVDEPKELSANEPVEMPTPAELQEIEERQNERNIEIFENSYNNEVRDNEWASSFEKSFNDFFSSSSEMEGNNLLEIGCKNTICRIKVSHANRDVQEQFLNKMIDSGLIRGEGYYLPPEKLTDDTYITTAYYSRKNTQLPRLDQNPLKH